MCQNVQGSRWAISQLPSAGQSTQGICTRNVVNSQIFSPNGSNTDFDNSAAGQVLQYFGQKRAGCVQYQGMGIWYDVASGNVVQSFGSTFDKQGSGALTYAPGTGNLIFPFNVGLGMNAAYNGTTNPTLLAVGGVTNFSSSGTTITLPTVTAANVGMYIYTCNSTAAAQTITITGGTQLFNNVGGRTTITLNSNASVALFAGQTGASTFGYQIVGGSSAMAAGIITAPT